MRYPQFHAQGLCTSSGIVEAGCEVAIGTRLKRAGMPWAVSGSNAIIARRCSKLSGRFRITGRGARTGGPLDSSLYSRAPVGSSCWPTQKWPAIRPVAAIAPHQPPGLRWRHSPGARSRTPAPRCDHPNLRSKRCSTCCLGTAHSYSLDARKPLDRLRTVPYTPHLIC